jgi:GAF domain-containing protein
VVKVGAQHFAELAVALHDEQTVEETLDSVLRFALDGVGCTMAGVVFVRGRGRLETAAATDPCVSRLVDAQVEAGEGPDLTVLGSEDHLLVEDVRSCGRWPEWVAAADELGVRSLLGVRLNTRDTTVGILNLYADEPGAFDQDDVAVAHIFGRHAAVALASARNLQNLWEAVDARKAVGQAQGILMERYGLNPDQAMTVLLRYSQDGNLKLRAVAEQLIDTTQLPSLDGASERR